VETFADEELVAEVLAKWLRARPIHKPEAVSTMKWYWMLVACVPVVVLSFVTGCQSREQKLHNAVYCGDLEAAKRLLDKGADVNAKDEYGQPLLMYPALWGHLEVATLLLDRGADVNVSNSLGWTPLHGAVGNRHIEVAKLLLDHGADANAVNSAGRKPLHMALTQGSRELQSSLRQLSGGEAQVGERLVAT